MDGKVPTIDALQRTLTTFFGQICLASLVVTFARLAGRLISAYNYVICTSWQSPILFTRLFLDRFKDKQCHGAIATKEF